MEMKMKVRKLGKLGKLGMLNRRIEEAENQKLFSVHHFAVLQVLPLLSVVIICILMLVSGTIYVQAGVPQFINYQGRLTDANGVPLDGTYPITFSIYNAASGGTALWTETHPAVSVDSGIFNITLGSVTTLNLDFSQDYYRGIKVGNDPEMTPRRKMVSVGYAFRADEANDADKLDSLDSSQFMRSDTDTLTSGNLTVTGNVGIGTTSPDEKLTFPYGTHIGWEYSNTNSGVYFRIGHPDNGAGPLTYYAGYGSGLYSPVHQFTSNQVAIMTMLAGGNVGIGTTNPTNRKLVIGSSADRYNGIELIANNVNWLIDNRGNLDTPNNRLAIGSGNAEFLTISSSGNVGIGTTSPDAPLEVSGAKGSVLITSTSPNTGSFVTIPYEKIGTYTGDVKITVAATGWKSVVYDIMLGSAYASAHHAGTFYHNTNLWTHTKTITSGEALTLSTDGQKFTFTIAISGQAIHPFVLARIGTGGSYAIKPSDVTITID